MRILVTNVSWTMNDTCKFVRSAEDVVQIFLRKMIVDE